MYGYRIHPLTATEEYGLDHDRDQTGFPYLRPMAGSHSTFMQSPSQRDWLTGDDPS